MKQQPLSVWTGLAIATTVIAALAISVIPMGVGPATMPWPNFTICVVFFWIVHRPQGMPTLAVLFIGLAHDLIGGGVVGAGMLAMLLASFALVPAAESLHRSAFGLRWIAFTAFAFGIFALEWALTSLSFQKWTPLTAPLAQLLVTVLAYPLVSVLFRRVMRIGRT